MKQLLPWIGVAALVAWTGGGAAAWMLTKDHVTVVLEEGDTARGAADDPVALLRDEVATLRADVSALAQALERNLTVLDDRDEERFGELSRELGDVRTELARVQGQGAGALSAELAGLRREVAALAASGAAVALGRSDPSESRAVAEAGETVLPADSDPSSVAPVAAAPDEVAAVEPPAEVPAPAKRASFLAFSLPSDDFRFDERRAWTVVPSLSRVGFDGKSTLHDFTGTTSAVSGTMDFDLAHPGDAPHGLVRVESRTVRTGSDGRDSEMFDVLKVDEYAEFVFELTGFTPQSVDATAQVVRGTATGTMSIRGVTKEFSMPVVASVDPSRRLVLEGEATLHLPDYGVPVPNKLGLITMEDDVRLWISLRARLDPRAAEVAHS